MPLSLVTDLLGISPKIEKNAKTIRQRMLCMIIWHRHHALLLTNSRT